jgi:hypothetical protein
VLYSSRSLIAVCTSWASVARSLGLMRLVGVSIETRTLGFAAPMGAGEPGG